LPWFTHDHDAHQDIWLRHVVRKQGHVAGWLWWVLLELLHNHGTGDTLKMDISDISKAALTSNSVVTRVLTELATEFQGQLKLRWKSVGTEIELEIKKFRERQSNFKSKLISNSFQDHSKTTIQYSTIQEQYKKENIKRKVFIPPTLDEIKKYCAERKSPIDPTHWFDYQVSHGWRFNGGRRMSDWQATIRTWERNNFSKPKIANDGTMPNLCIICTVSHPKGDPCPR
jgi:hypothetical protein